MTYNPHTDNAGQIPTEGDYVAYNWSGQIATGFIRHVGRNRIGGHTGNYTIEMILPKEGHTSRIRGGARCLLVLDREKDETKT